MTNQEGNTTSHESNDSTITNTTTKLEWINGPDTSCQPLPANIDTERIIPIAKDRCAGSTFAGHSDWRVPLASEQQSFIQDMNKSGVTPFYSHPACSKVIGLSADKQTVQEINTHNTVPVGAINAWASHATGLRCVRDK